MSGPRRQVRFEYGLARPAENPGSQLYGFRGYRTWRKPLYRKVADQHINVKESSE